MANSIYFDNYCNKIYNTIFTYFNFIISIKLISILVLYYFLKILKNHYYLILIDDLILYYMHTITILLLLCRFIYFYYIKIKINNSFNIIKNLIIELFSIVIISYNTSEINDIDDNVNNRNNDIVIHSQEYNNYSRTYLSKNQEVIDIKEFKDLLLFYISYYISIVLKSNNKNSINNISLLDTHIYENYIINLLSHNYYNFNINTDSFKLSLLEYNIKLYLNKFYNSGYLQSNEYKISNKLLYLINKKIINLQLYFERKYYNNEYHNRNNNMIYNQNNIFIIFINKLNDILIFITITITIIYYLNYLYDLASIIYILIISFIYLYLNLIINILFNNFITDQNDSASNNILFNIDHYSLNLYKLILNIHNEINILYQVSSNNINILYK